MKGRAGGILLILPAGETGLCDAREGVGEVERRRGMLESAILLFTFCGRGEMWSWCVFACALGSVLCEERL